MNLKVFNAADIFTGRLISEIPEALTALLTALLTLPHLHTVDLSDNAFGGRLAEPLKDFYSKAGPLRHLLLNNNGLGPAGGTIVANSIKELAAVKAANPFLPPLETITCGRNRLENGSMDAWASACAAHTNLKTVKLVQNGIRPEGIEKLLRDGLSQCAGLLHLDLQDNTFTATGAQALADVVPGWTKIEVLCVSDCLLSARGGILLGEALLLKRNCHLSKLGLQYNEIDVKAARVILTALRMALPKLKILELNGNRFSEDDPVIEQFHQLFLERGFEGLDSLSDLEEEESDTEEDDVVDGNFVVQEKNGTVDNLADILGTIKIA
ncbi:RNI-like protein [Wilcoxina mikolae CBS 423.85]|nr:RNI-like protein [Wilcoxina mikolae CBS 423.85]